MDYHTPALCRFGGDPRANDLPADDESPLEVYLTKAGNIHCVQPSPDGDYVSFGVETYPRHDGVLDRRHHSPMFTTGGSASASGTHSASVSTRSAMSPVSIVSSP